MTSRQRHGWRRSTFVIWLAALSVVMASAVLLRTGAVTDPPVQRGYQARQISASGLSNAAAARILSDWDDARAQAWAAADEGKLRSLYVAGSRTGRIDLKQLRAYRARGLRVEDLRMQRLTVSVVRADAAVLQLCVVDRLAGGVVVSGSSRIALPRDEASRNQITLKLHGGRWLVDEVVPG